MKIAEIRREKLRQLIADKFQGNETAFARAIDRPQSNVNRWLTTKAKERRTISEETARDIEGRLKLRPRYFDELEGDAHGAASTGSSIGELRAVSLPPSLEQSQEIEDVEISKSALELIKAWNALPLNERMAIKRRVEARALRYLEPIQDDNSDLQEYATAPREKTPAAKKKPTTPSGTQ